MRKERGAITIITLVTVLFMLAFLISTFVIIANRRQAQAEIKSQTKEIYEADLGNIDQVYEELIEQANNADIDSGTTSNINYVEYIEGTGTQYIDTGISGGTNAAYEISFNTLSSKRVNYEQYFAGDRASTIPKIYCSGNNIVAQVNAGTDKSLYAIADTPHVVRYDADGKIYVDGTFLYDCGSASEGWGNLSWYIFNSHEESTLTSSMKLYYLKMYKDGVLERDFRPALDTNGVPCLYDEVTKQYFYNAGTGTFNYE